MLSYLRSFFPCFYSRPITRLTGESTAELVTEGQFVRSKSHHFEGLDLVLPALNFKPSGQPIMQPRTFRVDPLVQIRPILHLGSEFILELPSLEQVRGFITGVVETSYRYCTLAMVAVIDGYLEVVYLVARRDRLSPFSFPDLFSWESRVPKWLFLSAGDVRLGCVRLFAYTANPGYVWEAFYRRWWAVLQDLREAEVSGADLVYAAGLPRGAVVRLIVLAMS